MRSICVFCGGNPGARPSYAAAARAVGRLLGERGITLVYGGASVGLMGTVADATLASGGKVVGVIPTFLAAREITHAGLTELIEVRSMTERKDIMFARSDAFLALPGGLGTMDELFEVLTLGQIGQHQKPVGLLDVEGYYTSLLAFLDHATREGLVRREHREALITDTDLPRLLDKLG